MKKKLTDNISLMLSEQGFTFSNWLHIADDVNAVVETGLDSDGLMGVDCDSIDLVVNSHFHLDHTRGNTLFTRAKTAIHESETEPLTDWMEYYRRNSVDEWAELMPDYDFQTAFNAMGYPGPNNGCNSLASGGGVISLKDGQIIDFGKTKAQVLLTPGHTAGHCSFWFPEEEFLFCGDICLTKVGPWYGEHTADPEALMKSIDRVMELNPKRLISAHCHDLVENPIPVLEEFKSRIPSREEKVYNSVKDAPCDIQELSCRNLIYREHPHIFVEFWDKLMLKKHLDRLISQGLVQTDGTVYAAR